jgi:DNA topoisomerase-1
LKAFLCSLKISFMSKNLVIVESPAKAKTIEGYLGEGFVVRSSYGHIRDLPGGQLAVDVENGFMPTYEVTADKARFSELKKLSKSAETVWLATDEDREGEAISWHLQEALKLSEDKIKRIVFSEITKPAILKAIENPRKVNMPLVMAQQARRILDRLVGYELSPVLWKKIRPSLSAGRVQSVTVRLLVDRERDILAFQPSGYYRVSAKMSADGQGFKAELNKRLDTPETAREVLLSGHGTQLTANRVERKPTQRKPAAPFTTSTLQQEASRKLGYSVSRTMQVAQRLYEAGRITYMRTDSTNLSDLALESAEGHIKSSYGDQYHERRIFKTKNAGAQEAHEAIRPTDMTAGSLQGESDERRLYELIFKRTLASQMANAIIEKTTVDIHLPNREEMLVAKGEAIQFDGFMKVYLEGTDDEKEDRGMLPRIEQGQNLDLDSMQAIQRFTKPSSRFSEAALVKKLEELQIGRPSTYASTIGTIQKRGYVVKEDREGKERKFNTLNLQPDGTIQEEENVEMAGSERSKLFPTDIGIVVTDFLLEHFASIMDFQFTAKVEQEFDDIAAGKDDWQRMVKAFYSPFNAQIQDTTENAERASGERELGVDPASGKMVLVRIGRYGPLAQIGAPDEEEKRFASLLKGQTLEGISLEEALKLFELPRDLGTFEDKKVVAAIGRFGPYVRHDGKFVSIPKDSESTPYDIPLDEAIEMIKAKREADAKALLRTYDEDPDTRVLMGRWGPYIKAGKDNVKIPKGEDIDTLDWARVEQLKAGVIKAFEEDTKWSVRLKGRQYYLVADKQSIRIPVGEKILEMTWTRAQEIIKGKPKKSKTPKKKA